MDRYLTILLLLGVTFVIGCRGMETDNPPFEPNLNMDFQERFDPQENNPFFADNRAMRLPVPGTVARGLILEDETLYLGRTGGGGYVEEIPISLSRVMLERGRERYDIFCAVCHGRAGDAQGIIMVGTSTLTGGGYGYTPAPTFHDPRLRQVEDGYLYEVITNGIRNMPPYGAQIPVLDRWAIVAYVRALQRSQNAALEDVPPNVRGTLQPVAGSQFTVSDTTQAPVDTVSNTNTGGVTGDTLSPGQ